jgi:hypothetical protein
MRGGVHYSLVVPPGTGPLKPAINSAGDDCLKTVQSSAARLECGEK